VQLIQKSKLAQLAGVSKAAITKALKNDRLKEYNGTGEIDLHSPLTKAFLKQIPKERLQGKNLTKYVEQQSGGVLSPEILETLKDANTAEAVLKTEKAKREKEARIKLQQQNTVRRADLFTRDSVMTLMLYIDKLHNNLRRLSGGFFDEMQQKILATGKPTPDLKQRWNDEIENTIDTAKNDVADLIEQIEIDQSRL